MQAKYIVTHDIYNEDTASYETKAYYFMNKTPALYQYKTLFDIAKTNDCIYFCTVEKGILI